MADLPGVLELLQYMLVRDPALRPTLRDSLAKLDAIMAINGHRMPAHVPPPPPTAAAVDSWGGGSAPDPPPTTAPREPALPLSCILAYLPTLLLGPISAVQQAPQAQQVLRSKRVHRVVVVTSGEGASVEDSHGLALPLLDIMGSEELSSCAETCAAAGASCEIIRGPPGFDPGSLVAWVEEALPAIVGGSRGSGHSARGAPVLVVAEEECVGDAVLLAVAHLVKGEGASAYQAMVRAAHICVDLHMTAAHLEAVRMLTK